VLRATSIVLFLVVLTGCAGQSPAPVGPDHPAHPRAEAAPASAPSHTLALKTEAAPADAPAAAAPAADVPAAAANSAGTAAYACPMHPKVTSTGPGKCPICGMALKPVAQKPATRPAPASATPPSTPPAGHDHDHGGHP